MRVVVCFFSKGNFIELEWSFHSHQDTPVSTKYIFQRLVMRKEYSELSFFFERQHTWKKFTINNTHTIVSSYRMKRKIDVVNKITTKSTIILFTWVSPIWFQHVYCFSTGCSQYMRFIFSAIVATTRKKVGILCWHVRVALKAPIRDPTLVVSFDSLPLTEVANQGRQPVCGRPTSVAVLKKVCSFKIT